MNPAKRRRGALRDVVQNHHGRTVRAYREEEAVAGSTATETFVALHLQVDRWRWAGVVPPADRQTARAAPGDAAILSNPGR